MSAWKRVASGTTDDLSHVSVDVADRVWVTSAPGALLVSTDRAKHFTLAGHAPHGNVSGLWSDGADRLVVCARGEVFASDDAGATWALTSCRGRHNDNLHAGGAGELLATNIRSSVLISRDVGARWKATKPGWNRYLYSVASNAHGVLCAGSDGALVVSRDGGAHWEVVRLKHRQYLRGAFVTPEGRAVLVGDEGRVELLDAKGKLTSVRLADQPCLYAVWGRDDELFAVGHRAYVPTFRHSVDGGLTWTEEPSNPGTVRALTAVAGLASGPVVAVGEQGSIWVHLAR